MKNDNILIIFTSDYLKKKNYMPSQILLPYCPGPDQVLAHHQDLRPENVTSWNIIENNRSGKELSLCHKIKSLKPENVNL